MPDDTEGFLKDHAVSPPMYPEGTKLKGVVEWCEIESWLLCLLFMPSGGDLPHSFKMWLSTQIQI